VEISWNEIESGYWEAVCQCGKQYHHELPAQPSRNDPLGPATFRHLPQCEHRDTTDPAFIRALLTVKEGTGGDYWWVTCSSCASSWAVPHRGKQSAGAI